MRLKSSLPETRSAFQLRASATSTIERATDGLLVSVATELGGEYFRFDEARQELRGERTGIRYAIGARLRVQVSRVDLDGRRIDFRLVREGEDLSARAPKERFVAAPRERAQLDEGLGTNLPGPRTSGKRKGQGRVARPTGPKVSAKTAKKAASKGLRKSSRRAP